MKPQPIQVELSDSEDSCLSCVSSTGSAEFFVPGPQVTQAGTMNEDDELFYALGEDRVGVMRGHGSQWNYTVRAEMKPKHDELWFRFDFFGSFFCDYTHRVPVLLRSAPEKAKFGRICGIDVEKLTKTKDCQPCLSVAYGAGVDLFSPSCDGACAPNGIVGMSPAYAPNGITADRTERIADAGLHLDLKHEGAFLDRQGKWMVRLECGESFSFAARFSDAELIKLLDVLRVHDPEYYAKLATYVNSRNRLTYLPSADEVTSYFSKHNKVTRKYSDVDIAQIWKNHESQLNKSLFGGARRFFGLLNFKFDSVNSKTKAKTKAKKVEIISETKVASILAWPNNAAENSDNKSRQKTMLQSGKAKKNISFYQGLAQEPGVFEGFHVEDKSEGQYGSQNVSKSKGTMSLRVKLAPADCLLSPKSSRPAAHASSLRANRRSANQSMKRKNQSKCVDRQGETPIGKKKVGKKGTEKRLGDTLQGEETL